MAHSITDLVPAGWTRRESNLFIRRISATETNQQQTNDVFSDKWDTLKDPGEMDGAEAFQKDWFRDLYGFSDEAAFKSFLADKMVILDAGCGMGYKSAWFAELAPHATVIGMDFSDALDVAAEKYRSVPNLYFVQGDISDTGMTQGVVDFVCCDQVIMHTEDPDATFAHLASLLSETGEFACYVYAKKALPRELLDDHFRKATLDISPDRLWEMSAQLTELGRRLSALNVSFEAPDIPELGIKGGQYDIQRFLYWNFLKCFWNEELGEKISTATNFDWYSPSNARRYDKAEFQEVVRQSGLRDVYFHEEEACYSGRFAR